MESSSPIAIVGMGGVFPRAANLAQFKQNIIAGADATRGVPADRWVLSPRELLDPNASVDAVYSTRACFVEGFELDSHGLDVDASLLERLDPLYHFVLHAGRDALHAARMGDVDPGRVGVVLAAIALPTDSSSALTREILGEVFEHNLFDGRPHQPSVPERRVDALNARVTALPGGLLAQALGLGGGSFTLDAACASSLYALKLACDELRAARSDAMLAGGVSRPESLYTQMGFGCLQALSRSGVCRPFDARADGLVVGEGAGIVVLKRLDDALSAGDHIHGVIRGIGLSNDIAGSLLAADCEGQLRAMRGAYEQAGWSPGDVDYIECHGTGTPLGDAVELKSLKTLFSSVDRSRGRCVLGSVKSIIGHLLTGAGAAGLIKTLLAMNAERLPPMANFKQVTRENVLDNERFDVPTQALQWPRRSDDTPRRAGVSAFGFGGINAHVLVEEWDESLPVESARRPARVPVEMATSEPIAIVGMAAHFGEIETLEAFRELILRGQDALRERSSTRWRGCEELAAERGIDPRMRGAFIDHVAIPAGRFRLPPNEIDQILPQQLLMLRVAADALADAGVAADEADARASVFVGMALDLNTSNYHLRWVQSQRARMWARELGLHLDDEALRGWVDELRDATGPALSAPRVLGSLGSVIASRIAREFRFGGPSFAVSAEEASGLRCVELALRALQAHEIDSAIAGAVDLSADVRAVLSTHELRGYSSSGVSRPLDARADGAAIGEGAAAVMLKRLADARRDGDRIYAVVRGVGFAGGDSAGRVRRATVERALTRAHQDAGIDAGSVQYVETHGSGSEDEARSEVAALNAVFGAGSRRQRCALGALSGNIGCAGAAAGMASLVKAALCVHERMFAPLVGFTKSGAAAALDESAFHVPHDAQAWLRDRRDGPRRAGVSAIGLDGNCGHVVLEEVVNERAVAQARRPLEYGGAAVFAAFADERSRLPVALSKLEAFLRNFNGGLTAAAGAWHRQSRAATSDECALTFVARDRGALRDAIDLAHQHLTRRPAEPIDGRDGIFYFPRPLGRQGEPALVYPGSGAHFIGMGRGLAAHWPQVVERLDAESLRLRAQLLPEFFTPWRSDWSEGWERAAAERISSDNVALIMGQVSFGVLMSDVLRVCGVEPAAVIGYSLGETTGLFAQRAWRDRDEMLERMRSSPLFRSELAGRCDAARRRWNLVAGEDLDWCVAVLNRDADDVRRAILGDEHAYLLITNAPDECVVGGRRGSVERISRALDCEAVTLEGASSVHCDIAREVESAYRELHLLDTTPPADVRFYSAASARAYEVNRESAAESITAQALHGFDFPKVVEQAYADGARVFVEVGPQSSCTRMISRILAGKPHYARSASLRGVPEAESVLQLVAALVAQRSVAGLDGLYGDQIELPQTHEPRPSAGRVVRVPTGGPAPRPPLPLPRTSVAEAPEPQRSRVSPAVPTHAFEPKAADVGALLRSMTAGGVAQAEAHDAYLRFSQTSEAALGQALELGTRLLHEMTVRGEAKGRGVIAPAVRAPTQIGRDAPTPLAHDARAVAFTREQCMEFAIGSLAKVLGPQFAPVDGYAQRVRLPDEPLMLVDRIVSIDGEKGSLSHGTIVTEHDVAPGAWYLDAGRAPVCIAVEAGQADLFLCSYLGIDLAVRGSRTYRLLDATIQFSRGLPRAGERIRYEIAIDKFVRQGDTWLFFFRFEGTIEGEPLISMNDGCAGFFTDEEIENSGGIVSTAASDTSNESRGERPNLVEMAVESYDERQVDALRRGEPARCFGEEFEGLDLTNPLRIPGGRMRLVHRVVELDPGGGEFGLGRIKAEADVRADDWFLTCHFVDDMVMPGTLMYNCCEHTLRILLMRMGWVGECDEVSYEPLLGRPCRLKCRGPVTPKTKIVTYDVQLKEIGYDPAPYVVADAYMFADGRRIVQFTDMSLKMSGLTRERVEGVWKKRDRSSSASVTEGNPVTVAAADVVPIGDVGLSSQRKCAVFDTDRILAFAVGNPSDAFGPQYRVFDGERRIARLPGPPYMVLDRITEIHAKPWRLEPGGWIEAQYDVPPHAWFFAANRQRSMPFCVLLEIALQPCGWLAAYLGSALRSAEDTRFRNLGGRATLFEEVFPDAGVLATRVRITDISEAAGMIIEKFDMQIWRGDRVVYAGDTYFGFFSDEALSNQVGIRDAGSRRWTPSDREVERGRSLGLSQGAPLTPDDDNRLADVETAALPSRALAMIDRVDLFIRDGGPHGLGYIRGVKRVDPDEWFFAAHFYQDPVCPGSLGLESFQQLLKIVALEHWGSELRDSHRFEPMPLGSPHEWVYRGQVIPTNKEVTVEAVVTSITGGPRPELRASGFLSVDGLTIYEMIDFAIRLVPLE